MRNKCHGSDKQHRDYLRQERPQWHHSEWQLTCFTCGIKGHKSINCPKSTSTTDGEIQSRVKGVIAPTLVPPKLVERKIGAAECRMFLNSGTDVTMVKASLVKDSQYTQENIKIIGVNGTEIT